MCFVFLVSNHTFGGAFANIPSTAYVQEYVAENKYTLPQATSSVLGGVTIGNNIGISSGKISVATADGSTLGVVNAGTNTTISNGAVNVATGTPETLGVVKVGQIPSGSATSTTYATIWVE